LERQKIEDELMLVRETIAYLEDLLTHSEKIMLVISDELKNLIFQFGRSRFGASNWDRQTTGNGLKL